MIKQFEDSKNCANATESQIEFLKFEINEIEEANIQSADEEVELNKELEILENAEKLKELTGSSYWAINGDDGSILEAMSQIKMDISKAANFDSSLEEISQQFVDALENLKDISSTLRDYSQNLENDTQRLNDIQERLFILDKLKRKYGGTLESVLKSYNEFCEELSTIEFSTQNIEKLEEEIKKQKEKLTQLATKITENRENYAQVLSVLIQDKLAVLELPKARFEIRITPKELSSNGADNVEFMISTNVSEDLKPLAKVASGGEISRVMLAIKSIFAQNDDIDTVIFDEIDTGISGRAAAKVGLKLHEAAENRQILCVTHLAQIAAMADTQLLIKKTSDEKRTYTGITKLDFEGRKREIARIISGDENDPISLENAEMLLLRKNVI